MIMYNECCDETYSGSQYNQYTQTQPQVQPKRATAGSCSTIFWIGLGLGVLGTLLIITATGRRFLLSVAGLTKEKAASLAADIERRAEKERIKREGK